MRRKRLWLVIGLAVIVAAAIGVGLSRALAGSEGGDGGEDGTPVRVSHDAYRELWEGTHLGDAQETVLRHWPSPPYQHYRDNLNDDCYEWSDEPAYLYNLCFNKGVLRMKELF